METLAYHFAYQSMNTDQLTTVVKQLEKFWKVEYKNQIREENLTPELAFAKVIIKAAYLRRVKFDTDKFTTIDYNTDNKIIQYMKEKRYTFVIPACEQISVKNITTLYDEQTKISTILKQTKQEYQKLELLNEILPYKMSLEIFENINQE